MAEQIGIVVDNMTNGLARVLTDRKGACGGCHSAGHSKCRSCLTTSAKLESHVANPVDAGIGDVVKISISQAELFRGAALMYLLPIAALIAGAVAGLWLAGGSEGGNVASVLGGLAGLGIGFWAVARLGRSPGMSRRMTPIITEIVTRSGATAREPLRPVKQVRPSCCG